MDKIKGTAALLIAAFIWGVAFVAQKMGMEHMTPFAFNGVRSIMGVVVLLPVLFISLKLDKRPKSEIPGVKKTIFAGLICGICLFTATNFQQVGIQYTTAGKAGFVTSMYIVIVPLIGIFMGKKIRGLLIVSLAVAVVGLYLLCIKEGFSLGTGDLLVLFCAFAFAFHIISVDTFATGVNAVMLSVMQFIVNGVLSCTVAFFAEGWTTLSAIRLALPALLFTAVCSTGIAYTLQVVGQKMVQPTMASLLMSFESVFSVLGGAVIMNEILTGREIAGCILMFAAVILSQLPDKSMSSHSGGGGAKRRRGCPE